MHPARFAFIASLALVAPSAWADHVAHEIPVPGGDGGWDYLSLDSHGERLFASHSTQVEVLDVKALKPVATIANTPGVHGVALAEELGRGYISAGKANSVVVFDLKSLAQLAEIKTTGENPDAILYEPMTQRVFTFNGRGHNATVIDAHTNQVIGTIPLDSKPEFAVHDATGHIFVNLEDKSSIAMLDAKALTVKAVWPMKGCEEPSGLAIDRAHARLFSVCDNKIMAIVDAATGRVVARMPIGEEVDGAGFDEGRQLAFASGGDGTLTVIKEETPEKFRVVETVKTKAAARTMTVDQGTHRVFLSTARLTPAAADVSGKPQRPAVVPNTFEVLVVEP